jgi:hypothetical protein
MLSGYNRYRCDYCVRRYQRNNIAISLFIATSTSLTLSQSIDTMPTIIDMPLLNTIERKRLRTNYSKLTGNAKNVTQTAIGDLDNSDIIAILTFGYKALEQSGVISNSATLYKQLATAEEHKICDFKVTHKP